ncbi:ICEBs1 excisionase [Listeria aquatica]|uniref:ICEBs1 excisionase n=1 Tax=Listeria aquatica TaxID=1494960 RepID=UPI003F71E5D2
MYNDFLTIYDVGLILGYKRSASQKLIAELNKELEEKGYRFIKGKVNKKYFASRFFLTEKDINERLKEASELELQKNA